jgi:hypothetical protein
LGSLIPIFVSRRAPESSTMFERCCRVTRLAPAVAALVALLSATPAWFSRRFGADGYE